MQALAETVGAAYDTVVKLLLLNIMVTLFVVWLKIGREFLKLRLKARHLRGK